jgi:DNA-binding MarR family transcriptional regulator
MDENIGTKVAQVARLMRRSFDERTRKLGLTRPQWHVLSLLVRHAGINQGGLADLLEVEPITLGRMIDRLQDADLVERRADPADRRAWRLYVTVKGEAMVDSLRPHVHETLEIMLDGIEPDARATLIVMLDRMRLNLTRKPAADGAGLAVHG